MKKSKIGLWKEYYLTIKIGYCNYIEANLSGNYKDGKKHGEWKLTDYNNKKPIILNYKDGVLQK